MCTKVVNHSRIKVEENRKKAVFINDERIDYEISVVDGCLINVGIRCDSLVSKSEEFSVLIELKGNDVSHACGQLFDTVVNQNVRPLLKKKIGFLVIASKYPKFDTFVRKAKDRAAKDYKSGFHVVNKQGEFNIARVVAIDGPY